MKMDMRYTVKLEYMIGRYLGPSGSYISLLIV